MKTLMRHALILIGFLILTTIVASCKKDLKSGDDCFRNDLTVRQITNKKATVRLSGERYYIIEENTIDTQLNPCNLAKDFRVDKLQVTISGDVKATAQGGPSPCCIDNFVITKITR